jgi:phage terminase large subunit GpA-like protein
MKDRLNNDLSLNQPGPGYCHFPDWIPEWFYKELTREKRDIRGRWQSSTRNEAWDLFCYAEAAAIMGLPFSGSRRGIEMEGFWDAPPAWAAPWEQNEFVRGNPAPQQAAKKPEGPATTWIDRYDQWL